MNKVLPCFMAILYFNFAAAQKDSLSSPATNATTLSGDAFEQIVSKSKPYFYGVRLYHENDVLTPVAPNRDDNYTGGIKLEFITNTFNSFQTSKVLNPLQWINLSQQFSFGFTVFTPRDLAAKQVLRNERPYASYTFFGFGAAFINQQKNKKAGYEILAGSMGKPLPGEVQKKLHREHWLGSKRPVPEGWDYEIANGGAFAANVNVWHHQQLTAPQTNPAMEWTRLTWKSEVNVGQYTTNAAQALRLNLFNYHYYYPDSDPPVITKRVNEAVTKASGVNTDKAFAFTFFIEPRLRLMLHNATLTGKWLGKPSVHTVDYITPVLLEYEAGAQVRFHFVTVGYTLSGRSREYRDATTNFHHWGGLYASVVHLF
jgi:hypothetical protein